MIRYKVISLENGYKVLDQFQEGLVTSSITSYLGAVIELPYLNRDYVNDACRTLNYEHNELQSYTKEILDYCFKSEKKVLDIATLSRTNSYNT